MTTRHQPQLWVIAGPNGAGKSTLCREFIAGRIQIVNPDEIALAIAPDRRDDPKIQLLAGRKAITDRRRLLQAGDTFALETTLTGQGELRFMQAARDLGYKVNLVFIGLADVGNSRARVARRVNSGGHAVPDKDLGRRFGRSLAQMPKAMLIAHRMFILDNSGLRRRLLLVRERGNTRFVSKKLPKWAKSSIPKGLRQSPEMGMGL